MSRPDVRLRRAGQVDADLLLAWRNDPVTRASSFQSGVVEADAHAQWLAAKIASPGTEIWIAEVEGRPAGQVRFDICEEPGVAIVDITVAPEFRGRGLGKMFLASAIARQGLAIDRLRALVKPDNEASAATFRAAGFSERAATERARTFEAMLER